MEDYIVKFADFIDEQFQTPWATPNRPDAPFVKIFRRLMTQDDAKFALSALTPVYQTVEDIASRTGKDPEEFIPILDKLVDNGCIVDAIKDGVHVYKLAPMAPGILEFQMNKRTLDKEMVDLIEEYYEELATSEYPNLPMGTMRIVPVAQAIEADDTRMSFEEVMTFINATDRYAVAPCLCRTMKRAQGEGCGHMLETCMLFGDFADYYVRTGRGRAVSREELIDILKKCEEDGLVHHVFSFDKGFSEYICNCCGCCCLTTRSVTQMNLGDGGGTTRTNYCAEVDKEACVACGACVDKCIFQAVKLGDALCKTCDEPVPLVDSNENPAARWAAYDKEWSKEKWDKDYRVRPPVLETGTSPCKTECPAHISVQGYIRMASLGKYMDALELIKRDNPFPAVCGRICPHPCESVCTRANIDEPVAIDPIKRFIAELEINSEKRFIPKIKENPVSGGKKVAVIGAGPSGLSCAYYLAIEGYDVTVFEKEQMLGGMLTMGIPSFRLDRQVINAEIDVLRKLGVKFRMGVEVGKFLTIDQLRSEGFEAFYFAIGARRSRKLGIEGENLSGVMMGVDFLRDLNLGKKIVLDGPVAVIGGGNVAIDVARTAVRAGATSVDMYSLECREEMPAWEDELAEALEEGVRLNPSWGPKAILGKDGKVSGVELKRCTCVFDKDGRFRPQFDESETKTVKATIVLIAIGQEIQWGGLLKNTKCKLTETNTIKTSESLQTDEPDIFAGGDAVTGPKLCIDAIAAGKYAAISIHRYLRGDNLMLGREGEFLFKAISKDDLDFSGYDRIPRERASQIDPKTRVKSFADMSMGLTEEQVRKETERCIGCGASVVDPNKCMGCGICTVQCKFDAIKLVRVRNEIVPETPLQYIQDSMKYRIARAARIEENKAKAKQ